MTVRKEINREDPSEEGERPKGTAQHRKGDMPVRKLLRENGK